MDNEDSGFGQNPNRLDKRNRDRIECNFKIEFHILDSSGMMSGRVINIGPGGLLLLTSTALRKGERINLFFPFRSGTQMLEAEVLRTEGREVAVEFNSRESETENFIQAFNAEYLSKGDSSFLNSAH